MSDDAPHRSRTRWSFTRVARLGFLVGQGWDAKKVAGDPTVASTANNVHRQAQRFGLAFREAAGLRLPHEIAGRLDEAAIKRGISREGVIRALLMTAGSEAGLIDNILDDGH